ncbi:MAG: phosphopantetheine-binding protein [Colwellia sp.]
MTSVQNSPQLNQPKNQKAARQITKQLITLLRGIIPNYEDGFWHADTALFGAIAEFDSMALVTLMGEIEDSFDISFDDDDISAENFSSVTTLTELVLERS